MTNTHRCFRFAVAAVVAMTAAGCSADATGPAGNDSEDLKAAIEATAVADMSTYSSAAALTSVPGVADPEVRPRLCPYSAQEEGFICPTVTAGGLTFQRKFYLYDAGSQPQSEFDPATTDAVRTVHTVNGTLPGGGNDPSIAIHHTRDVTLAGLLGSQRTIDGEVHDRDTVVTTTGQSQIVQTVHADGEAINVVPQPGVGTFPASGSLTQFVTATSTSGGISASAQLQASLTFNGTRYVPLVIQQPQGTTSCTIDLRGLELPDCN